MTVFMPQITFKCFFSSKNFIVSQIYGSGSFARNFYLFSAQTGQEPIISRFQYITTFDEFIIGRQQNLVSVQLSCDQSRQKVLLPHSKVSAWYFLSHFRSIFGLFNLISKHFHDLMFSFFMANFVVAHFPEHSLFSNYFLVYFCTNWNSVDLEIKFKTMILN